MKYFAYILIFLISFQIVSAQVVITEIMYDLPKDSGSDSGREWVEILNKGSEGIDLSSWRFYEAEVNHKLKLFQGKNILSVDKVAIIADNPEKFLIDWPNFSGTIFDSSFSLKNTGETIVLRDVDLNDIDTVSYNSEQGAKGDGSSLQKTNSGWVAAIPTPGSSSLEIELPSDENADSKAEQQKQLPPPITIGGGSWPIEPQIFARVKNAPYVAVVGADVLIEGEALGFKKELLTGARYLWTLGDGGTKEGEKILYNYNYPGKYVVILNASSGKYTASDRVEIKVIPADIIISSVGTGVDSFIEVQNNTKYELDLSWWRIRLSASGVQASTSGKFFTIPKDTIVLSNSKTIFPPQRTEFNIKKGDSVELLYPNGVVSNSYNWTLSVNVPQITPVRASRTERQTNKPKLVIPPTKIKPLQVLQNDETKIEKKEFNTEVVGESQSANIFMGASGGDGGIYKWLLAVVALIIISILSVFFVGRRGVKVYGNSAQADKYEIIEDKD